MTTDQIPSAEWRRSLRRFLLAWYRAHRRALPWRAGTDPYPIWISEIMLQQTTVAAVVPYFMRFLERFPTVAHLAAAEEHEVLRLWEGLGYYSRARHLHRTAQVMLDQYAGKFPRTAAELRQLPGIGRYTAGAIASFAFQERAPIVEANTQRVYSRLLGFRGDPRSAAGQDLLWSFAETILPRQRPGELNQALMELGQVVCVSGRPHCESCPVRGICRAAAAGAQEQIPLPARRPEITAVQETALAIRKGERYLLAQRLPGERWAGLWDFVRLTGPSGAAPLAEMVSLAREQTALQVASPEVVGEIRHTVTRFRITLRCLRAEWKHGIPARSPRHWQWTTPATLHELPLSVSARRFAKKLLGDGE